MLRTGGLPRTTARLFLRLQLLLETTHELALGQNVALHRSE
jgi:hypothetical protein